MLASCTPGQCLAPVSAEQTTAEDVIPRGQGSAQVLGLMDQTDHRLTANRGPACGLDKGASKSQRCTLIYWCQVAWRTESGTSTLLQGSFFCDLVLIYLSKEPLYRDKKYEEVRSVMLPPSGPRGAH